jgi:hypothetical protein
MITPRISELPSTIAPNDMQRKVSWGNRRTSRAIGRSDRPCARSPHGTLYVSQATLQAPQATLAHPRFRFVRSIKRTGASRSPVYHEQRIADPYGYLPSFAEAA